MQEQIVGGGPPVWTGLRVRLQAEAQLVSGNFVHSDEFIRLTQNPGGGKGGTCFGDSGGPDLLGGTDTVLAVNSYVTNGNCAGVGTEAASGSGFHFVPGSAHASQPDPGGRRLDGATDHVLEVRQDLRQFLAGAKPGGE